MAALKANAKANGADGAQGGDGSQRPVKRRVLIVEDDTLVGMGLKAQLERLGHSVIGQASTAPEAQALYREHRPDIVLLDIRLDDADGIDVAGQLLRERRAPMIIISAYSDKDLIDRAGAAGVFGYLIKPANAEALQAQMEVAVRRFEEQERLAAEKRELEQTLETRKLIERAKGVLMETHGLRESEAFHRIRKTSMDARKSMKEVAEAILLAYEMEFAIGNGNGNSSGESSEGLG